MPLPRIQLQALDAFERVAQTGSVQEAARQMGLSISSVSSHIARLEDQLGLSLFDRSRRPFSLTREGQEALHHLAKGLHHLRRATSETAIAGLRNTRSFRMGIVEDFEGGVAPELAVALASRMPRAKLSIRNVLSHEAPGVLRSGNLDVAIASGAEEAGSDIRSEPLLRDQFLIAAPRDHPADPDTLLNGRADLPFLRFNPVHLIGRQIEAHLARNRIELPNRYSFDSAQSIMAIVANGDGWSLITPLGFLRAQRYAERVRLHSLPRAAFARRIALLSRPDVDAPLVHSVAALFRQIVDRTAVGPFDAVCPALAGALAVLDSGS